MDAGERWLAAALVLVAGVAAVLIVADPGGREAGLRPSRCPISNGPVVHPAGGVTPYPAPRRADRFLRGATLDLSRIDDPAAELPARLRAMRDRYHIATITVYGLERWDAPGNDLRKDRLFEALASLGMTIVVRVEAYDPDTFAFTAADLNDVIGRYGPLIGYVSAPARRDRIEYFALNMPVDDPAVQRRLGGINSPLSMRRQVEYATAFVAKMRAALNQAGLPGAPLYLGIFYGWDHGYDLPSYAPAQADGYSLTNYSYPGATIADETASDADLINVARLRIAVDRFNAQYPGRPSVVEYGFQTLEYQRGTVPSQRAGLVANVAAKRRAVAATTRFYCVHHPGVRGTMYFGYNVYKREGAPAAVLDFTLDYSR